MFLSNWMITAGVGGLLLAAAVAWRIRHRARMRGRIAAALRAEDPQRRRAGVLVATGQGLRANAGLLAEHIDDEQDPAVLAALVDGVLRNSWEPADQPAILRLRLWAHERQRPAVVAPALFDPGPPIAIRPIGSAVSAPGEMSRDAGRSDEYTQHVRAAWADQLGPQHAEPGRISREHAGARLGASHLARSHRTETHHAETHHAETHHAETHRAEPRRAEPRHAGTAPGAGAHARPDRAAVPTAGPGAGEPRPAGPGRADLSPSGPRPGRISPSRRAAIAPAHPPRIDSAERLIEPAAPAAPPNRMRWWSRSGRAGDDTGSRSRPQHLVAVASTDVSPADDTELAPPRGPRHRAGKK